MACHSQSLVSLCLPFADETYPRMISGEAATRRTKGNNKTKALRAARVKHENIFQTKNVGIWKLLF